MIRGAKAIILDHEDNVLILYRSGTHPHVPNTPDLPGGKVEEGETMIDGLLREVKEETGIELVNDRSKLISTHKEADYYDKEYYLELYEVKCKTRPEVRLSYEHDTFEWVPRNDAEILGKLYSDLLHAYQKTHG